MSGKNDCANNKKTKLRMLHVVLGFQIVRILADCQSQNKIGLRPKLHLQTCWSNDRSISIIKHDAAQLGSLSGYESWSSHAQYQPPQFCSAVYGVLCSRTLFCTVHEFISVEEPQAPPLLTSVGPPLQLQRANSPVQPLRCFSD